MHENKCFVCCCLVSIIITVPNIMQRSVKFFHFTSEKHLKYSVNASLCSQSPTWLDLRGITAWKAVWVESGMLSLGVGHNNGQVTDPNSYDGIELLWMKCYVSRLCLCYLTILSVWTTVSGTDGQRHDPPFTIAKQIHCHIVCLSPIGRSNVSAVELWLCFIYLFIIVGSSMTVSWKYIYSPQFEAQKVMINDEKLTSTNQLTVWFKHFIIPLVAEWIVPELAEPGSEDGWWLVRAGRC